MKYNVDYFIAKFEGIPEDKWCVENVVNDYGQHCAWGHIGYSKDRIDDYINEGLAFENILINGGIHEGGDPSNLNNGDDPRYQQPTPKQRTLAALYDIKKMQQPETREDITKQLAVDTISETLDVVLSLTTPTTAGE